jgi:hypothetical protein
VDQVADRALDGMWGRMELEIVDCGDEGAIDGDVNETILSSLGKERGSFLFLCAPFARALSSLLAP